MSKTKTNHAVFRIREGDYGEVYTFVENMLTRKDVTKETASEALLVFDALMQKLVDWGLDEDTDLKVSGTDRLGEFRIKVEFEGKVFAAHEYAEDSIEDRILAAHDDKLNYSYHTGYNAISISVSRSHRTSLFACEVAFTCAIIAYIPMSTLLDTSQQQTLLMEYVFPLEKLYTNAMLMIGAPMTFFSLLKNMTDTYVVSQKSSSVRRLQAHTISTSVFAILLAFVAFFITGSILAGSEGYVPGGDVVFNRSFSDVVTSLVPDSIFKPFEAISPMPLIAIALLSTYALCSAGKYFDSLRHAMMACYTLFSRMLHVVIALLPLFCFVAIMDVLLDAGFMSIAVLLGYFAVVYLGFFLLFVSYAVRLRAHGIKVIPFMRKLGPLLRENASIGSAIDATPYNIRYCVKTFKMKRAMLERNLPVLAEINLDGNCFILMMFTLTFVFISGMEVPLLNFIGLGLLVLFLSFGAPNQPGSILIGTLIILMYFKSFDVLCAAIYSEAFLGIAQNLINVIGDIVMVAIEDSKEKAGEEGA